MENALPRPLGRRILAQRIGKGAEKTKGGIVIPEQYQDLGQEAIVQSVGRKVTEVAVGDTIVISHYAGTDIKFAGQLYAIVTEEDILGKAVE